MTTEEPTELTLREQFRAWWKGQIAGEASIDLVMMARTRAAILADGPAFARALTNEFLADGPAFARAFTNEFLADVLYRIGIAVLTAERAGVTRRVDQEEMLTALGESRVPWERWFEYEPASGKHIRLFDMTRSQVLAAAGERRKRVEPDLRRAAMLELIADRLTETQTVKEVWTEHDVTVLESRIELDRSTYTLRDMPLFAGVSGPGAMHALIGHIEQTERTDEKGAAD